MFVTYVPFGGSAEARTALLGGHGEYMLGNLAEIDPCWPESFVRSRITERAPGRSPMSTLTELASMFRCGFVAFGRRSFLQRRWRTGAASGSKSTIRAVAGVRKAGGFTPVFIGPDEMKAEMDSQVAHFTEQLTSRFS